ncbi:hypothetical protein B0H34DRAFT_727662 [Crassisporium funariophilum]|nr:hypothetical protein B0H34DRAFT_727662 [Crassisporium funariophilum]
MGMGMAIGILGRGRARSTRFGWRERTSAEGLGNGKGGREGIGRSIGRTVRPGGGVVAIGDDGQGSALDSFKEIDRDRITGQAEVSVYFRSVTTLVFISLPPIAQSSPIRLSLPPPTLPPPGPSSSPTLPLASNPSLASAPLPPYRNRNSFPLFSGNS